MLEEDHRSLFADLLNPKLAKIVVEYLGGATYLGKWGNRPPGWEEDYLQCREKKERCRILKTHPDGLHCPHRLWVSSTKGIVVCDLAPRKGHRIRIFNYDGSFLEDKPPPPNTRVHSPPDVVTYPRGKSHHVILNTVSVNIRVDKGWPIPTGCGEIVCSQEKVAFLPNDKVAVCAGGGISIFGREFIGYDLLDRIDGLDELGQRIEPVAIIALGNILYAAGSGGFFIHVFRVW